MSCRSADLQVRSCHQIDDEDADLEVPLCLGVAQRGGAHTRTEPAEDERIWGAQARSGPYLNSKPLLRLAEPGPNEVEGLGFGRDDGLT